MLRSLSHPLTGKVLLAAVTCSTLPGLLIYLLGEQTGLAAVSLGCPGVGLAVGLYLCHQLYRKDVLASEKCQQLHRLENLHAAGQLSLGLAHELRNPLAAIKGYLQLLARRLSDNPGTERYLTLAVAEIDRVAGMLEDFLHFSRSASSQFSLVDVGQIMEEVLAFIAGEAFCRQIKVHHCYGGALPPVKADGGQLKQVFLNLLLNALAAVAPGGRIWVGYTCLDEAVVIHIKDNGCGMDEEILARLGEPFFTTKVNGTGLGLALSYRIIKEHGGRVTVASQPGEGTLFSVQLPVANPDDGGGTGAMGRPSRV